MICFGQKKREPFVDFRYPKRVVNEQNGKDLRTADSVTKTEVKGEIKALMRHVGQGRAWSLPQKKGFCDILQACGITRPQVRALARVARRGSARFVVCGQRGQAFATPIGLDVL